jgi:hypothetical protein
VLRGRCDILDDIVQFSCRPFLSPSLKLLFLKAEILQPGLKSIDIAAEEDSLRNEVQDIASTAHMTLRSIKIELFAEELEARCIIRRIICDEVAKLVTDIELANNFSNCL